MEEIKLNIENLTKEERDQLLKLVEKANKKGSVWKPQEREEYYFLDDRGFVHDWHWFTCIDSALRYNIGNCFKTKEEAEFALERHKVIVELERFAKENNNPDLPADVYLRCYKISKHNEDGTFENVIGIYANKVYGTFGTVAFSDITIAENAVKTIGEDRLIKYYFGIKD